MREYPKGITTGAQRAQYNYDQAVKANTERLAGKEVTMTRQLKRQTERKANDQHARRNGGIRAAKRDGSYYAS